MLAASTNLDLQMSCIAKPGAQTNYCQQRVIHNFLSVLRYLMTNFYSIFYANQLTTVNSFLALSNMTKLREGRRLQCFLPPQLFALEMV